MWFRRCACRVESWDTHNRLFLLRGHVSTENNSTSHCGVNVRTTLVDVKEADSLRLLRNKGYVSMCARTPMQQHYLSLVLWHASVHSQLLRAHAQTSFQALFEFRSLRTNNVNGNDQMGLGAHQGHGPLCEQPWYLNAPAAR